jgi:hypothetical protein
MSRVNAILPENLKQVLDMRRPDLKCRKEVEDALQKYGLIRVSTVSASATATATATSAASGVRPMCAAPVRQMTGGAGQNRFMNLGHCAAPEGWRSKNVREVTHAREEPEKEDRWVSVSGGKKRPGFRNREDFRKEVAPVVGAVSASTSPAAPPTNGAWRSSRFQPLEDTMSGDSMEDRIMGKVRAKVNKLGYSTYDATKAFMKQILDSGEVDFLDEFMRFVFQKAATETAFCGLYARFLHDLSDEFPHLRKAMVCKFREYTRIFDEASKAPDVGTTDYKAFVEAQEQKKFRRGYSQFVAELAKMGEVSMEDFRLLVNQVVETIRVCHEKEENRLLCEEVIDCYRMMVQAVHVDWMKENVDVLRLVVDAPRDAAPGLSNKGRFALMDILDLVAKGR